MDSHLYRIQLVGLRWGLHGVVPSISNGSILFRVGLLPTTCAPLAPSRGSAPAKGPQGKCLYQTVLQVKEWPLPVGDGDVPMACLPNPDLGFDPLQRQAATTQTTYCHTLNCQTYVWFLLFNFRTYKFSSYIFWQLFDLWYKFPNVFGYFFQTPWNKLSFNLIDNTYKC